MSIKPEGTAAPSRSSFRPELQGLRALAVGLVLLYHLWPNRISGGFVGVDVFFVVSGFLITGHLYKELSATGTIALSKFWARRVMRLLPLALTVLAISFIAMLLFLPETVWGMDVRQILSSVFYVENWVLAADSVDYMAADNEPSLVQHYWSLSIEEQFYILLPLVLLGSFAIVKYLRRKQQIDAHRLVIGVLLTFTALSFIFSVLYTNYDSAQAYFVTPTRFWEFTIGGLLAMAPAASKMSPHLQNLLGWSGFALIIVAGLTYDGNTPFPGYTALLPVIGTTLFLRYGSHQRLFGIYWWASRKPFVRMGDWSYAMYLWHWPLIIVATYQLENFWWGYKLLIIALTLVLSSISQRLIEDPLRKAKYFKMPKHAFGVMGASMVVVAAAVFVVPSSLSPETDEEIAIEECTGANAFLRDDCNDEGTEGEPTISATQVGLEGDEPAYPECFIPEGYTDFDRSECSLGASQQSAHYTIAVLGDSHARSWLPMLDEVGKQNNWNIQGYTKSGCPPMPLTTSSPEGERSETRDSDACHDFNIESSDTFKDSEEIDGVVVAAAPTDRAFYDDSGSSSDQILTDSLDSMWQEWENAGKDVFVIGELPHFRELAAPTCVASNPEDIVEACSLPAEEVVDTRGTPLTWAAEQSTSGINFYDPEPGICHDGRCYSMVGNLITRYDGHHLSEDFSRSFGDHFSSFVEGNLHPESS